MDVFIQRKRNFVTFFLLFQKYIIGTADLKVTKTNKVQNI